MIIFGVWNCKIILLFVVFTEGNRERMATQNSDKEHGLNSTIQPFAREIIVAISSVEMCGTKVSRVFCCLKSLLCFYESSPVYYTFDTP
jgi:hypothetical protein